MGSSVSVHLSFPLDLARYRELTGRTHERLKERRRQKESS